MLTETIEWTAQERVIHGKPAADGNPDEFRKEILALCRDALPAHKMPASIRIVAALDVGVSGKLARVRA